MTDALTLPDDPALEPMRELARAIEERRRARADALVVRAAVSTTAIRTDRAALGTAVAPGTCRWPSAARDAVADLPAGTQATPAWREACQLDAAVRHRRRRPRADRARRAHRPPSRSCTARSAATSNSAPRRRHAARVSWQEWARRRAHLRRSLARRRAAERSGAQAAGLRAVAARRWRRRPDVSCPRRLAASATGTTGSAGFHRDSATS